MYVDLCLAQAAGGDAQAERDRLAMAMRLGCTSLRGEPREGLVATAASNIAESLVAPIKCTTLNPKP